MPWNGGSTRRIKKERLRELVESNRGIAKQLAGGEGASKKAIEQYRRALLKHLDESEAGTESMSEATAERYAKVLGVSPDEFLEPPDDPVTRQIERREAQIRKLETEIESLRHEQEVGRR